MCILKIFVPGAICQNHYVENNVVSLVIKLRILYLPYTTHLGVKSNAYVVLVGKPEGKRQLRRRKNR